MNAASLNEDSARRLFYPVGEYGRFGLDVCMHGGEPLRQRQVWRG